MMNGYKLLKTIPVFILSLGIFACGDGNVDIDIGCTSNCEEPQSRNGQWNEDIDFLKSKLEEIHPNLYHTLPQSQFEEAVNQLKATVDTLSDQDMIIEIQKIIALPGSERDGHMIFDVFHETSYRLYPIKFYQFSDGVYVVSANTNYQHLIGRKLVAIENTPLNEVNQMINPLITRDNEGTLIVKRQLYYIIPEILSGLGIINDPEIAEFTFSDDEDNQITELLEPVQVQDYSSVQPLGLIFSLPVNSELFYLQNFESERFWMKHFEIEQVLYVKYNDVRATDYDGETLDEFLQEASNVLSNNSIRKIIIDVRQNTGGDNTTFEPFIEVLKSELVQQSDLYVFTDRGTFSAAANFVAKIKAETSAIFVGEAPGGSASQFGDTEPYTLPNSMLRVYIPTIYHDFDSVNNVGIAQEVDISIMPTSIDYFQNIDPLLDTVLDL